MTDISIKSFGSSDQMVSWLLHNNGTPLATGFVVTFGETTVTGTGVALTASMLWLDATGVGVVNYVTPASGANRHNIISLASAGRTFTIGDASIAIIGFAGNLYPETVTCSTADVPNSTVTAAALTGLSFTPVSSATYEFEGIILVSTTSVTTGPQIKLTGPAETSWVTLGMWMPNNTTATELVQYAAAWGVVFPGVNLPTTGTPYPIRIKGIFRTTGSAPTSAVQAWIQSEVATSSVSALADSFLRVRRIR